MPTAPDDIAVAVSRDEGSLDIEAFLRGTRVGYAWCMITHGKRLELCDLVVSEQAFIPYPFAHNLLISIGIPCRTRNFRQQGIGRLLMRRLIDEARATGIVEIWGSITQADIDNALFLLEWCRRLGFTVTDADQECIDIATRKISMGLVSEDHPTERGTACLQSPQLGSAESRRTPGAANDRSAGIEDVVATHQHTPTLRGIAKELLSVEQSALLDRIIRGGDIDFPCFVELDETLGWACMSSVSVGNTGNYVPEDRSVFRPLQYCGSYFAMMQRGSDAEWLTRQAVHMASLHVEALVSRISLSHRLPLGQVMRKTLFMQQVDSAVWQLLDRFRHVYNAAKHEMGHQKDTHLFSREDAVLAYFICRVLGNKLRHLAKLETCFNPPGGVEEFRNRHNSRQPGHLM